MPNRTKEVTNMKSKILAMTIVVCLVILDVSIASAACRIMPLGDSITQGVGEVAFGDDAPMVGYRQFLRQNLLSSGYAVDFVGSQSGGYAISGFDWNHEGHGGWTSGMVANNIYQWLMNNPADIILLHIGTNDIGYYNTQTIVNNVNNILNIIDSYESTYNREVTVILAEIINRTQYSSLTTSFNSHLRDLVADRQAAGDLIILVDMENALVYPDDLYDLLHPNSSGYAKMADVWLGGLQGFLPCGGTTYTIWNPDGAVGGFDTGGDSPVELGVKFRADLDGYIEGIRFYKYALNTGTHVGNLWTSNGTNLGSVTFTGETSSGWQQANFETPIPITANTTYIASYHATAGHFAMSLNYFSSAGVDNAPLHALRSGVDGLNGVYCYGAASCFPNQTYATSNYWVDVAFVH